MAAVTQIITPHVSEQVSIGKLGYKYNVTGLTPLEAAPVGKTMLIITMPSGFKYSDSFLFAVDKDFKTIISPDEGYIVPGTVTDDKGNIIDNILTVTFSNDVLKADTSYFMSLNIQPDIQPAA